MYVRIVEISTCIISVHLETSICTMKLKSSVHALSQRYRDEFTVSMTLAISIFSVTIHILISNLSMLYNCTNIYKIKEMLKYALTIKGKAFFLMHALKYTIHKPFKDARFAEVYLTVRQSAEL